MGGVLATLFLTILICFASCDNGSISGGNSEDSQSDQNNQFDINYSLRDAPQSNPLQEGQDYNKIDVDEDIYIEFDIPTTEKYWTTRVYIEGLGAVAEPDGIYLELDLPKNEFSRCDVTIDGIGKVAEEVKPLDESKTKGCFFYPFLEVDKEYTIRFSFKKPEPVDSAGFTLPTPGDDTLTEVTKKATAGPRAKGEVHLPWENVGYLKADSECNIVYFQKPEFKNEQRLGNNWMIEIGLMEGVSWTHGDEHRTKWHCAVKILPNDSNVTSKNLRELDMSPGYASCNHNHDIDCICVRPIMLYKYGDKTYKYQWDGDAFDVHYPLNAQEININNPTDIAKIKGTWKYSENWDTDYYFLE